LNNGLWAAQQRTGARSVFVSSFLTAAARAGHGGLSKY